MEHRPNWTVDVEDCYVDDKAKLREFRRQADIWIDALDQDAENSVTAQIHTMMGDDAKWRSLNEARKLAVGKDDVATSGIVASLLDRGYVAGQIIAIARLLEKGKQDRNKQVNSLRRLVDEISQHRGLLTREVFICRDGLPYDWETARQENPLPTSGGAVWTSAGQEAWITSMGMNAQFDALSGKGPQDRSRDDLIEDALFDRLSASLKDQVFVDIEEMRHKTVAHAADRLSRSRAANLRTGIALNEFARAHYLLLGVYQTIAVGLLYQSWLATPIAVPQDDIFENLDKPMVAAADLGDLHDFWSRHVDEREDWMSQAYREIMPK